jgi:GT2 family glycosyltransferase
MCNAACGTTPRVHNHWSITLNALRSLVALANATAFEVIVADDASTDATTQLGRQLPWLRIWRSEQNQGFLDTCNGAAALARGELLLLVNKDTLGRVARCGTTAGASRRSSGLPSSTSASATP